MKKIKISTYSAVELDAKSIKIAQSQLVLARPKITRLVFSQIDDISKPENQNQVRRLLEREKIEIDSCILSIPRHSVTTRYLKLPTSQEEEIDKMVKLQVPKLLPYAAGEIVYSYRKIGPDREGYSHCLVIMAQQNLVRLYYSFMQSLGISPEIAILSSQGAGQWLRFVKPDILKSDAAILVDIDVRDADIMIISSGELIFTRSIARQASDIGQDQNWCDRLIDEINLSLQTANKEIGEQRISRLILTGSISGIKGIDKALVGKFPFPVEAIATLNEEFASSKTLFGPATLEPAVSFTSVVGAVLTRADFTINLLPSDIRLKISSRRTKIERRRCILLGLLILFLLFILFAKNIFDKARVVKVLDQRIKILLPKASTREQVNSHFQTISSQLKQTIFVSQILKEIYKIIPDSVSLNSLSIQRDKLLTIKGEANNLSDIFSLVSTLEKNPYFENVRVRYATKRRAKELEVTDFQIDCPLVADDH